MCGIAGIFVSESSGSLVDPIELAAITDSMVSRGPDGSGQWIQADRRVGFGHRRLAILDLSTAGAQPLVSFDNSIVIVFNGEIYNYKEIRLILESKGYQFFSNSDTEVLVNLYLERGTEMVDELRGMYSFAIYDKRSGSMFLARDPLGIKPLYYSNSKGVFRFASQVRALLQSKTIDKSLEPAGHVGFFLLGAVPEPYTLYRGIRSLPSGSSMLVLPDGRVTNPYCFASVNEAIGSGVRAPSSLSVSEGIESIAAYVKESIKAHLISDVPIGVFLSAGLDSTMLAAVSSNYAQIRAMTLAFEEYKQSELDEAPLASQIARKLGIDQDVSCVAFSEFHQYRNEILNSMDQPSIDGVNTWFVAKMASDLGIKVALSGVGGDELFGSYPSFRQVPQINRIASCVDWIPRFGRSFRVISEKLISTFTSPKFAGLFEYGGDLGGAYLLRRGLYMPWELTHILDPELVRTGWADLKLLRNFRCATIGINNPRFSVAALEMVIYMRNQLLRDADWAGMANSVEIRVPFADYKLIKDVAPILAAHPEITKTMIANQVAKALPQSILARRKTGFLMPISTWQARELPHLQRGLRDWACFVYTR